MSTWGQKRRAIKLTQAEVAQLLGVHQFTVSKWERGVLEPSGWRMAMVSEVYRASPERARRAIEALRSRGVAAAWRVILLGDGEDTDAESG